jgi:hypothetical protein
VVLTAGVFAAAGSLIARWRRARGVERQQMKWLAYAAAMLVVAQVGASLLPRPLFLVVTIVATLLFPAATGIAVVRYRLYEIDRIINRTLVYVLLTALLGAVYGGRWPDHGTDPGLAVASTLRARLLGHTPQ